ncbi:hypothetical protein OMEGA_159 [Klebsiella phage vB_KaeM_KaOmega]|nr:hypothetical protein OMEGA_159 [Klebsiella phage vB_KaeM_KaOmega]
MLTGPTIGPIIPTDKQTGVRPMKHYLVNIPGVAGPLKVFGYDEQDARKRLRDREGFGSRLPRGTKFYLQNA